MDLGLAVDVKLFHDEITGMISEPLRNNQYIASNSNESQFSGAETQLDWRMTGADRLRLTYAYVDAKASNPLDEQLTARNSGSAGWLRDWGQGWNSSLFYYAADALNGYRYERLDTRLARRIPWARPAWNWQRSCNSAWTTSPLPLSTTTTTPAMSCTSARSCLSRCSDAHPARRHFMAA